MNKDEVKQALIEGKTVKHEYYSDDEWLRFNGQTLITEDGYHKGTWTDEFWSKYQWWENGWSIVKDNKS
jgi:hypothetical protein